MKRLSVLGAFTSALLLSVQIDAQETSLLDVSFVNSEWDGITVPEGQHCKMFDGNGSSPALKVENIPEGANALIISFSDRSFRPNDNGGHGMVGLWLSEGAESAMVSSIAGESNEMPEGMFVHAKFRSNRGSDGAYLPPCSGGRGNEYYAKVTAVFKTESSTENSPVLSELAEGSIEMGKY